LTGFACGLCKRRAAGSVTQGAVKQKR